MKKKWTTTNLVTWERSGSTVKTTAKDKADQRAKRESVIRESVRRTRITSEL